jgi:hypothetical protein
VVRDAAATLRVRAEEVVPARIGPDSGIAAVAEGEGPSAVSSSESSGVGSGGRIFSLSLEGRVGMGSVAPVGLEGPCRRLRVEGRDAGEGVVQLVRGGAARLGGGSLGVLSGSSDVRATIFERNPPSGSVRVEEGRVEEGSGGMTGRERVAAVGRGRGAVRRGGAGRGAVAGRETAPVPVSGATVGGGTGPVGRREEVFRAARTAAVAEGAEGGIGPEGSRIDAVFVGIPPGAVGPCGMRTEAVFRLTGASVTKGEERGESGPVGVMTVAVFRVTAGDELPAEAEDDSGPEGSRIDAVFFVG